MNLAELQPPSNQSAERALLGGIFRDPETLADVSAVVGPDAFSHDAHRRIFAMMLDLRTRGEPITLEGMYRRLGSREEISGSFLGDLFAAVPTGANCMYHAGLVRDVHITRSLIHATTEVLRDAYSPCDSVAEMVATAERKIHAVGMMNQGGTREARHIGPVMRAVLNSLDDRIEAGGGMVGLLSGYPDLDAMLGGMRPGELIVVGARPSLGKTALALNMLANIANAGTPVLFASLEQRIEELAERLLAMGSGVSMHRFNRPRDLTSDEIEGLQSAASDRGMAGAPIYVDDASDSTAARIASVARHGTRTHGIQILAVDYLQLMRPENPQDNRTQQIGTLAMRMKQLARELSIPVILLSQLNRESDRGANGRPLLSHLRDSGDIEAHADKVLLLNREEMPATDPVWMIDVIVAKNRNGPIGDVRLAYRRSVLRFENSKH